MSENQPESNVAELQAKLADLESANAELTAKLDSAELHDDVSTRKRSPGRAVLAVVLIVL